MFLLEEGDGLVIGSGVWVEVQVGGGGNFERGRQKGGFNVLVRGR